MGRAVSGITGGIGKALGLSRRNPPEVPNIPPQPSSQELMDVIDEISGIQTITVTGPDGKKRRVTQRLPLTPHEQQIMTKAENLITTAVNNISQLYKYDPTSVINYQPFINTFSNINQERMADLSKIGDFKDIAEKVQKFKNINRSLAIKEFDMREKASEESLARRGVQHSTEASEERAARAAQRALLEQELDVNAENYGEDLAARRLNRDSALYGIREAGRLGRLQEAEAGYNLERQKEADLQTAKQNAINENINMLDIGQNIKGADTERARLALAGNSNAINLLGTQSANANQRYANEVNRILGQNRMELDHYNATPATFGQQIRDIGLGLGGQAVGRYVGGKIDNLVNPTIQPGQVPQLGKSRREKAFYDLSRVGR